MPLLSHHDPASRIAVTGIGVMLANAASVPEFWSHLHDGRSQIDFISRFTTEQLPVKVAAEVRDFDYRRFLPALTEKHARKYSHEILLTMAALEQARADAGLRACDIDPERVGFVDSSSRSAFQWWHDNFDRERRAGNGSAREDRSRNGARPADDDDFDAVLSGLPGSAAPLAAIHSNIRGLVTSINSACVGGLQAIGVGVRELLHDAADTMFVGGHDCPIVPSLIRVYSAPRSRVLTRERSRPAAAMKPYDRRRDGFALGEGAVVLCLERLDRARRRGARIYAEVVGCCSMNEAAHPVRMDLSGSTTAGLIARLLQQRGYAPADVDYFCAHGTATRYNDIAECRSLAHLYYGTPRRAWAPIGSVKPIYGHCLGAAGTLNVAASSLMVYHQTLCPTINLDEPDEECRLDHVSEGPRRTSVNLVVSLAFAIGSQTAAVAVGAPE